MKSDTTFRASGYRSADIALFRDAADMDRLLADFPVMQFATGEDVPAIVNGNAMLYFVLRGGLTVSMQANHRDGENADTAKSIAVPAGECAGAFSVLGGERRGVSIRAAQATEALAIDADGLWKLIDEAQGFAHKLLALRSSGASLLGAKVASSTATADSFAFLDDDNQMRERLWLETNLDGMTKAAREKNAPFSLLMISLNDFDQLMATHTQTLAQEALNIIGTAIMESLRPSDVAVRYADNALVVLLPGASVLSASIVAYRLTDNLKKTALFADGREPLPQIMLSIGVACLDSQQEIDLITASTAALNRAKHLGWGAVST